MSIGRLVSAILLLLTAAAPALAQSVTVELDQFGVGNMYRPGEVTALRLRLTSTQAQPMPVWVQWEVPNVDGDVGEYGRSLTLTPNQPAFTWLYAPISPDANNSTVWTVRVFEERDGQRRGEIGGTRISPGNAGAQFVDLGISMMAVVGQSRMGLDGYTNPSRDISRTARPVSAHEDTRITANLRAANLPDRWYGLMGFEALAWSGDSVLPQDIGLDQAEAILEYVRRGGHLIISLPADRNPWGLGVRGQTELESLLPGRTQGRVPRKDDAVSLADLLPVISKHRTVTAVTTRTPPEFSIRVFKDLTTAGGLNVIDNHFEPLIAMPDGRVVVIQRWYGFGRVTLIGIDLSDGRLAGLGLPQADAFWNRILGRRADTPTAAELRALATDPGATNAPPAAGRLGRADMMNEHDLGSGRLISEVINMQGRAGQGLLLALVLFAVYWLLAGPLGFGLLKQFGQARHAWVAFAACAAIFTAIAWGGVSLFPKRVQISHVTFLDHIARPAEDPRPLEPQYQRAVSYFSAYLPDYGPTPITINAAPEQRDLLMSWVPPGRPVQPFPNVDRYRVDVARGYSNVALPARSTATQLYAHWLGGLDRDWGGTLLVDPNHAIRVEADASGNEYALRGRIVNELPGRLRDVSVIWVRNLRAAPRQYAMQGGQQQPWVQGLTGGQLNAAWAWRVSAAFEWNPGVALDLAALDQGGRERDSLVNAMHHRYIQPYSQRDLTGGLGAISETNRRNYLEMLSMFQQLNPPEYLKQPNVAALEAGVAFQRHLGRELDLSNWFNRPCLIITGFVDNVESPIPLRIAGVDQVPVTSSITMVRWIYPLPLNERVAFRDVFEGSGE